MKSIPKQITVDSLDIDVHVIGPGYGEGIVIKIGDRILIGIDACLSLINPFGLDVDYLERILRNIKPPRILIWVLTHFHYDHFRGLAEIIKKVKGDLRVFVLPEDYTSGDIASSISRHVRPGPVPTPLTFTSRQEYAALMRQFSIEEVRACQCRAVPHYPALRTNVRARSGRSRLLSVDVYGAPVDRLDPLRARQIVEAVDDLSEKNRRVANFGSYVLVVRFGTFSAAFFGDAPSDRTVALPWDQLVGSKGVSLLKVAHHGSNDGTSRELLVRLSGDRSKQERVAVITPFKIQRLPSGGVVDLLKEQGFSVKVCGDRHVDNDTTAAIREELGWHDDVVIDDARTPMDEAIVCKFSALSAT